MFPLLQKLDSKTSFAHQPAEIVNFEHCSNQSHFKHRIRSACISTTNICIYCPQAKTYIVPGVPHLWRPFAWIKQFEDCIFINWESRHFAIPSCFTIWNTSNGLKIWWSNKSSFFWQSSPVPCETSLRCSSIRTYLSHACWCGPSLFLPNMLAIPFPVKDHRI